MERFVTDERTGLKYELDGDYYRIAGEDAQEGAQPIGVWVCGLVWRCIFLHATLP